MLRILLSGRLAVSSRISQVRMKSNPQKKTPITPAKTNTTMVVRIVSSRSGHTTLRNSMRAACANWRNSRPYQLNQASKPATTTPPPTIARRTDNGSSSYQ